MNNKSIAGLGSTAMSQDIFFSKPTIVIIGDLAGTNLIAPNSEVIINGNLWLAGCAVVKSLKVKGTIRAGCIVALEVKAKTIEAKEVVKIIKS